MHEKLVAPEPLNKKAKPGTQIQDIAWGVPLKVTVAHTIYVYLDCARIKFLSQKVSPNPETQAVRKKVCGRKCEYKIVRVVNQDAVIRSATTPHCG